MAFLLFTSQTKGAFLPPLRQPPPPSLLFLKVIICEGWEADERPGKSRREEKWEKGKIGGFNHYLSLSRNHGARVSAGRLEEVGQEDREGHHKEGRGKEERSEIFKDLLTIMFSNNRNKSNKQRQQQQIKRTNCRSTYQQACSSQ